MRKSLVLLSLVFCSIGPAAAQVSIGIGMPGVSIGINMPVYPRVRAGAQLPRLLCAASQFELFLL